MAVTDVPCRFHSVAARGLVHDSLPMRLWVELINEAFASYEAMPFGLEVTDFTDFAIAQCQRRVGRLRMAREEGVEAALLTLEADELAEDGTGV